MRRAVAVLSACLMTSAACRSAGAPVPAEPVLRIGFGVGSSARENSLPALTDVLYAEPLLAREWNGRTVGRLAESWQWNDGGRTLRLRLKSGVLMHDQSPFTAAVAADVLSDFVPQPQRAAPWGFEHVTGVTAADDHNIVLTLSQPDIFLLSGLADRKMVRREMPDVGTGPFRLLTREPQVEARRFDGYHLGRSPLSGVRILTYDTPRSVWAALMRREIDAAQEVSRESVEFMERSTNVEVYPTLQPFYVSMVFNHRHPAFRNVEVRRALNEAVDRAAIIQRAMRGRGLEANAPIWPLHWAYEQPKATYAYDPEHAKARLDRAGFRLSGETRPGEVRSRFKFTCMVYAEDPQYERIALMVQRQLFDIGVDMQIELVGMDGFAPRAAEGRFDAFLMRANAGRSADFAYRLWRSPAGGGRVLQNSGYEGADRLWDDLRASVSDDEQQKAVVALGRKFHDDAPAVFIAWLEVTRAVQSTFDVGESATQDPFSTIWQWRPREAAAGQ